MARPCLCIVVEKGPKHGHSFKCEPPALATVGRDRSNSLQITRDVGISQRHLCFRYIENEDERKSPGWVVEDKGSSNGTILNGSDIEAETAMTIKTGDIIKIGAQTTIRVEILPAVIHHKNQDKETGKTLQEEEKEAEECKKKQLGKKASANKKKTSKKPLLEMQAIVVEEEETAEEEKDKAQIQCKKASHDNNKRTCRSILLEKRNVVAEDAEKEEDGQRQKDVMKPSNDKKETYNKPIRELQEAVITVEDVKEEDQRHKRGKKASGAKKKTKTCEYPVLEMREEVGALVVENKNEEDQREKDSKKVSGNKKNSCKLEVQAKEAKVQKPVHCKKPLLVMREKPVTATAIAEEEEKEEEEEEEKGQSQTCAENDTEDEVGSMTVKAWFDHMMEEGPKYLYRVSESIIQDMKVEAEKFDEYVQSL